ncbi:MAG TPA: M56 family metallopeptidase, partial [Pirellulaceae bacterium]|nr:M56 family metallopeptidase [Pirellulaceae bacterium]
MNLLTDSLVWCVLQITLLAVLALALCASVRRWSLVGNAALPAVALAAIVVLTVCAFLPWPAWWRFGPESKVAEANLAASNDSSPNSPSVDNAQTGATTVQTVPAQTEPAAPAPQKERAGTLAPSESPTVFDPVAASPLAMPRWLGSALGVLLGIGVIAGLVQIVGGLLSIRSYRRRSQRIDDAELNEQLDVLQAELGLVRCVELRECNCLTTAATCGWRRPLVLLPPNWRQWSAAQRRAVLAHELAHVTSGDFLACILAQFGLALHFYHPLVHWLVAHLRLEQELAADATAAALAGGRREYLTTLAELALHLQERSLGWPAHTFLPTPGTFLRRIEMLRDSTPALATAPRRRWAVKWMAVGVLLLGAALIAGLRGGTTVSPFDRDTLAQDRPDSAPGASPSSIDLKHVTNDARFVLIARPAQALAQEEIRTALASSGADASPVLKLLTDEHLQQITLIGPAGLQLNELNDQVIAVLEFDRPMSLEDLGKTGALPQQIKPLNLGAANDTDELAGCSL